MTIVHDTRDKPGKHKNVEDYWIEHKIPVIRSKLYVGDVTRLDNQTVCIDLKQGLQEVYSNLVQDHDRFKAECIKAKEAGIKLVVLVQEPGIKTLDDVAKWENPRIRIYKAVEEMHRNGKWLDKKLPKKMPMTSDRLVNIMRVMSERYGVEWVVCHKSVSGRKILEILGGDDG